MEEILGLISAGAGTPADRVLARAFVWLPAPEVRAFLEKLATPNLAADRRRAALLVLAEAGSAADLARACDAAGDEDAAAASALAETLTAILGREPAACAQAARLAPARPVAVAEALIQALSGTKSREGARALLELGASATVLSTSCFSHLDAVAAALPRPAEPEFLERLHELLAEEELPGAAELTLVAGRIEDDEAVPLLLARLGSTDPELRANALWSLRRITGFDLGRESEAWTAWFAEETRWWSVRSPAVLQELRRDDARTQCAALCELGQRFWRRQRVADELCAYLSSATGAGATMACGILGRLRCESARSVLEARAADGAPELRKAADAALEHLSGKKIPVRSVALPRRRANAPER